MSRLLYTLDLQTIEEFLNKALTIGSGQMPIKYSYDNRELVVNNIKLVFDYNIRFVKEVNTIVIVLLEVPYNVKYLNNVFGVSSEGKIKWRIRKAIDDHSIKNPLPYENLMVHGENVFVTDFYGRRFSVNPINGKLISSDIAK
ncbi:hypothetical protein GGQ92_002891 [Gracilibacillus halotolerans]|uniref:Uncharacterized protein n=1 Tax=Gracilibacillus halotolerans TaxID=74386 RepID=A0A841RIM4_9BACI|nr:hypothetical protein [Gracilibacillus halotolerans]MBB6514070.1 hypothetical protein [Gracilibacillus halotolerans]